MAKKSLRVRVEYIPLLICLVGASSLLVGCDSQAHFSQQEMDQIKNKTPQMPAEASKDMATKQQDSARRYQEDMQRLGRSGSPAPPPGATQPPPGATH